MPSPPPGASSTIYVTPKLQSAIAAPKTLSQQSQGSIRSQTRSQASPRTPSPGSAVLGGRGATPKPGSAVLGGQKGRGIGGTSNGSSATPSSSLSRTPSSRVAPPSSAGNALRAAVETTASVAGGGFTLTPAARLFWKGVGAGIGWEAARQFQGSKRDITSEAKEQDAIGRAEAQKMARYLDNPPYTEVIEKEKLPFEGGQSPGVSYRVEITNNKITVWNCRANQSETDFLNPNPVVITNVIGPISAVGIRNSYSPVDCTTLNSRNNEIQAYAIGQNGQTKTLTYYTTSSSYMTSVPHSIRITRTDGLPDTGGNPPPTQQETRSQYNGVAPGGIALDGGAGYAPPPALGYKPQPQPQPRPKPEESRKSEPAPPPFLYAPGVRGDLGGLEAPSPDSLGGQNYFYGSSGVGGTPSGLPSGIGTPSGLPEGVGSASGFSEGTFDSSGLGTQGSTSSQTETGQRTQTQTQSPSTGIFQTPLVPPLLIPAAPTATGNDVDLDNDQKLKQSTQEEIVTQTPAPSGCEITNACVINKLGDVQKQNQANSDALDRKLQGLDLAGQLADLALLRVIDNKLGPQLDGGISGYFRKAWQATKMDKVLNAINTLLLIHNAAMLSRNLGETLGDAASAVLQFFNIKDHEQNNIDVNEVIGRSILDAIKGVLGEEVYTGVSKQWNLYNRIITAGMGVVAAVQNMVNAALDGLNTIGSWIAKMGNRAQEQGLVDDNSWRWMDENPNFRNPTARFLEKIDNLEEAADSVYMLVSSGIEVQEGFTEAVRATTALTQALNEANETKADSESAEKAANTSPTPTKLDVVKHEPEEQ